MCLLYSFSLVLTCVRLRRSLGLGRAAKSIESIWMDSSAQLNDFAILLSPAPLALLPFKRVLSTACDLLLPFFLYSLSDYLLVCAWMSERISLLKKSSHGNNVQN